ncbi:MAG: cob(I)yrinic acid a,c-diamide adenosyltransferase [Verrucomicrobia bacterium]|nr:cob(I)yrinic acid a,c-diamide adenosyltransferase [Verrucomicrobiota bacterium]
MSITSKTGDNGTTGLLFGRRISKTDDRIFACGAVDELSAALGMARTQMSELPESAETLFTIQKHLIKLMSKVMVLPSDCEMFKSSGFKEISQQDIDWIEEKIHTLESRIPPVQEWVIPGDDQLTATLHFARTVCRRAERGLWMVLKSDEVDDSLELQRDAVYLNRLSDLLWILARQDNG